MDAKTFHQLPTTEIAQLVRAAGSKVCVFPLKGTRRWFTLEHAAVRKEDFAPAYLDAITKRSIELYRLIFEHGLNTLLMPAISPDVMARGNSYMQMAAVGLSRLATHPDYINFYQTCGVRVMFYGDYGRFLAQTPYAYLIEQFDQITARTLAHDRQRLFFGLFAHDPVETTAELAIRYYAAHGRKPDQRTLVEMYYGEYVEPVDLFIGFGKLRAFDMPLITTGREDLYFTLCPSLYLTQGQLRDILYDHLYARTKTDVSLSPGELRDLLHDQPDAQSRARADLQADEQAWARDFYRANRGKTLGLGIKHPYSGRWYPLPQAQLPADGLVFSKTWGESA
jgi:tuberculosinol/isotuberculosinol synthase